MIQRREFNKTLFLGGISGAFALSSTRGDSAANNRLQLGFIGVGTMGRGHLGSFLGMNDVQVVSVCDVEPTRLEDAKKRVNEKYGKESGQVNYQGCTAHEDFRDLLNDSRVDAVVIATPDHWHAVPCVMAARLKKHIYCEKPLTHSIAEGRFIQKEVAKSGVVFQTGSQQRSEFGGKFRLAAQLVRSGRLGKIKTVRVGVSGPAVKCDLPTQEIPPGTNWDMWVGPAPMRGYNEILCPKGLHRHFPAWRNYWEYAGGGLADMGAHHFDIAQWALNMDHTGPVKIIPPASGSSGLKFVYANGIEMFHGGPSGCTFEGTDAVLYVDRSTITCTKEEILKTPLEKPDPSILVADNHRRNWLDGIRNGTPIICPPEIGHRSASICHLGNLGYRLNKTLVWDPASEVFPNDSEANRFLLREYRSPWTLEEQAREVRFPRIRAILDRVRQFRD